MWRDWEETNLAAMADYINGYAFKPSDWGTRGLPIIRIAQITGTSGFDNFYNSPLPDKYKITLGDLIFSWSGTLAVVEWDKRDGWLNQHLFKVIPSNRLNKRFFFHALRNSVEEMTKRAHGSTMHHIKRGELTDHTLHIPSDEKEQKAIAEVLDTVDEAIAATQAMLDKQDKIKDGLLQDLLTRGVDANGKLRPTYADAPDLYKQSPLGFIPKEWAVKELDESNILIIDGDRGEHYPSAHEFLSNGYCLFLSATNVTKRGFKFERTDFITKEKDSKLRKGKVSRNDVVLTTRGTVGNFAFYTTEIPYEHIRINSGMVILRNEEPDLNTEFFFNSFGSFIFKQENQRSGSGSAQPQLPIKDLVKFNFLKPSIEEQIRINQKIASFTKQQVLNENELTKLKKLKAGLMQDLLTGKKRISKNQREAA
ncbi:MAG: hypothetical protein CMH26_02505 [Micavibrio sp.]|nr:hypothetical protein [Micavibrio sp.]|tara:strand:+ start:1712 stop:2983 length:1272 start_codon:yes stop_codon:yes gene_type:complete